MDVESMEEIKAMPRDLMSLPASNWGRLLWGRLNEIFITSVSLISAAGRRMEAVRIRFPVSFLYCSVFTLASFTRTSMEISGYKGDA